MGAIKTFKAIKIEGVYDQIHLVTVLVGRIRED